MIATDKNSDFFGFYGEFWKLNRNLFSNGPTPEKIKMLDDQQAILYRYNGSCCFEYMKDLYNVLSNICKNPQSSTLIFPVDQGTLFFQFMAQFWLLQKKYINGGQNLPLIFSDLYWNCLIDEAVTLTSSYANEVWYGYSLKLCISFICFQEKRQRKQIIL